MSGRLVLLDHIRREEFDWAPLLAIRYRAHGRLGRCDASRCSRARRAEQTELVRRAGVTQSVISAYESGHRQPLLSTLTSLVAATGFDLQLRLATPIGRSTRPIGRRVGKRRSINAIVGEHDASNVRVFDTVARGEERADSDVDLLVDLPDDAVC